MSSLNPRLLAHELAQGLVSLNSTSLRKYKPRDLKALLNELSAAQRKIRTKQVAPENMLEMKEKHRQMQNVHRTIMIINGYIKKHHIQI